MSSLLILILGGSWPLVSGAPKTNQDNMVKLQVLYETLCPGCRQDMTQQVSPVYNQLSAYLDIHLYPYGNARTTESNGTTVVTCQHGSAECYGNKLHACAIDILKDPKLYISYIACMMEGESTDGDATQCASTMQIDANPILKCANSDMGNELLIKTGEESRKIDYHYVPFMVLNGQHIDYTKDLKTEICRRLCNPPPACL